MTPGRQLARIVALVMVGGGASANQGLVARDGSLGAGPLEVGSGLDPLGQPADYLITPDLGEQRGASLFHSFARFSIGAGEAATFTGPDPVSGSQSISHILGRVTGGATSQLDGTLRSTVPGADLWLINPSGLVFGPGARLDVQGSFHAATADSIGFDDAGLVRFYADPSQPSVLSVAEPRAFGFLGASAGAAPSLRVEGSALAVPLAEALSLVSSDGIALDGATLSAENGRVNLAAGSGPGDVVLAPTNAAEPLEAGRFADLGAIELAAGSAVNAGGVAPGTVFIRGGRVVLDHSRVLAENHGAGEGGQIDVEARESLDVDGGLLSASTDSFGSAGIVRLSGDAFTFRNGPGAVDNHAPVTDPINLPHRAEVGARAETTSTGAAGRIEIDAHSVEVSAGAALSAQTVGADGAWASGPGGLVRITGADSIRVAERGYVTVESWGSTGDAGSIEVADAGSLQVNGDWLTMLSASVLAPTSRFVLSPELAPGRAGTVDVEADTIELENGGLIHSTCYDCVGGAGEVHIRGTSLRVEGVGELHDTDPRRRFGIGSVVGAAGFTEVGDAGLVTIELTGALEVRKGAGIGAGGGRHAGTVSIRADSVVINGAGD